MNNEFLFDDYDCHTLESSHIGIGTMNGMKSQHLFTYLTNAGTKLTQFVNCEESCIIMYFESLLE